MSGLRERQREMTRNLIIDAVAELVLERGAEGFSLEDVAVRADVSARTLYRYFENRRALLEAVGKRLSSLIDTPETTGVLPPLDECLGMIAQRYPTFSRHETLARATAVLTALAERADEDGMLTEFVASRQVRHDAIRQAVREAAPHMDEHSVEQLFGVVRLLASIVGWANLTSQPANLEAEVAGVAVQWTLQTMFDRVKQMQAEGIATLEEDLQ